jgi:FdrA protein
MAVIVNHVRKGFYLDSVALMRISRALTSLDGVEEAGLMIGTPANKEIMREARVLAEAGEAAGPGDLVIAVRAKDKSTADAAIAEAASQLDAPRAAQGGTTWRPRSLRAAQAQLPDASLALISVPGDFAIAEARKAINRGLDVMIFSDNVAVEEEAELKREARALGRLVMGPDCGTAIIGGVPLAFANVVPRGDIGIVGASGTGIQEVSCLIARAGRGVSHAIGTGGRDLKAEVGAITTLMAIDALDADPATQHIVIISKPPAADVAQAVLARVGKSAKPFTICFLGARADKLPANAKAAATLEGAAEAAVGKAIVRSSAAPPKARASGRLIRGLYTGGTLCAEAQVVLRAAGADVVSNVPIPGAAEGATSSKAHMVIDLGDDEFTRGRPHPMIEPAVRDAPLAEALAQSDTGVVLLDCVLGFGGHDDPAGHLASVLRGRAKDGPPVIASVTGTDVDPQRYGAQVAKLAEAGVVVEPSNAAAVRLALRVIGA